MRNCTICSSTNYTEIYSQKNIPTFQNKVYKNPETARSVLKVDIHLVCCTQCGFIFNEAFDPKLLDYDENYQNEQANSAVFFNHLNDVYEILHAGGFLNKNVIEIGCGKGFFLEFLSKKGLNVTGYDPAYEGKNEKIVKDYFSEKYATSADFIILRHTLEHIAQPYEFLCAIAKANRNQGQIYIEVPTFKWIVKNQAFEDIFNEHPNYFTPESLRNIFRKCVDGELFEGQYMYVIADLSSIKPQDQIACDTDFQDALQITKKVEQYQQMVTSLPNAAIWGAAAKGCTFANMMDQDARYLKCAIDINPVKQGKYLGGTGHSIISPDKISDFGIENIIIMNKNYIDEIKLILNNQNINIFTL